jgi:hypothetical protein
MGTSKKAKQLIKDCREYIYWHKCRRWIANYDIVTCIRGILTESDNDKLTETMFLKLEVHIDQMTEKMGKRMPWRAFKRLMLPIKLIDKRHGNK